ncbi:MAG: hypothetical protein NT154_01755 [Verrucomicrobia bacterium]|nr:hypothetical protein [Verrucomicrobiota bacterium]
MKAKKKALEALPPLDAKCLALNLENLRLQRKIAKLEAQLVSERSGTIARLENTPPEKLSDEELTYLIRKAEQQDAGPKKEAPRRR